MNEWESFTLKTSRGTFEIFKKGKGKPLCVTHLYSEFNFTGDYFAKSFTKNNTVYLVNLREAGKSEKAHQAHQLSMIDSILDLEAIRTTLGFSEWIYAGHSTGGMLGLVYGVFFSSSLKGLIVVGASAREYSSNPTCIYNKNHPQYQKMQDLIEALKSTSLTEEDRKEISKERTKLSLYKPSQYDEYFSEGIHKKMSPSRMNFFSREILLFDITKKLKNIHSSTFVGCGKFDVQCPLVFSKEIAENISHVHLEIFNESNHYPFLEEKIKFEKATRIFLKNLS